MPSHGPLGEIKDRPTRHSDGARMQCPNGNHRDEPLVRVRTTSGQIKTVCKVFGCPNVAQWIEAGATTEGEQHDA